MAKTRRRPFPRPILDPEYADPKYGNRGNARGKSSSGSVGQSSRGGTPSKKR